MSKKHFIALANMIRNLQGTDLQFSEGQLMQLAWFCEDQNINFKRDRWLAYIKGECGQNGGAIKKAA